MFKNAQWIWKSKTYTKNSYGWFFKNIEIESDVLDSKVRITAHNHFKLLVNGQIVSGLVTPAPSRILSDKLYLTYDIKRYLKTGINKIEVIVLYLGGSGQNYVNGQPGFILSGYIRTRTNFFEIVSDKQFKAYRNIPYLDNMPFQQSRNITPVQMFDTNIELNELDTIPVTILKGYNNYNPQKIPEGKIHRNIEAKLLYENDGVFVYDCEEIISGFVSINILPENDEIITIRYSEDLENKRVKYNVANEYSENYKDMFKVKKNVKNVLKADFTYKAFRYFEIETKSSKLDVVAHKAGTGINLIGSLESKTNPEINQLFSMFKKTQKNNILGLLVDCPHREQAQYLGDSALQAESIIYNIEERKELLEKVIEDFSNAQYEDGTFPFVSPGHTEDDGRFHLKIPEYDLYFIELIYKRFIIDFDRTIYNKYETQMVKLLNQYIKQIDQTGLVLKNNSWHISDWPYPTVEQEDNYLTFENMLLYKSILLFEKLTDKEVFKTYYLQIANKLKDAIKKHFKVNGLYKDNLNSKNYHQGIQAFALSVDLFELDEIDKVLNYIVEQNMSSSIILGRTVLEMLLKYRRVDEALAYVFDFKKGWGHIIRKNSPTMWEGFDDIESHSHAWGMYPIRWIQTYVLGIEFDLEKENKITIKPQISKRINQLAGEVVSELGLIKFSYEVKDKYIEFIYSIPEKLEALFIYNDFSKNLEGSGRIAILIN